MNRTEFNKRIQDNFDEFKTQILNLTKEEIFENSFEINFKTCMTEYLQNEDNDIENEIINALSLIEKSILDELFDIYLNNYSFYVYDDMCEEILEEFMDNGDLE